jgi:hypothetical protein
VKELVTLFFVVIAIQGCVKQAVVLKNDLGKTVTCESSRSYAFMASKWSAKEEIRLCVETYEKKGYKKIR